MAHNVKTLKRITLDEALERTNNVFSNRRPPINVSPKEAIDKILAKDIVCDFDVPHLPVSMVDGYAFNSMQDELAVIAKVGPGSTFDGKLEDGQAIEVMTGALLPADIKFVVPKEYVTRDGERVKISSVPSDESNIMPAGFDCKSNEILAKKGERVSAGLAFFLNYVRVSAVSVCPQARAGIVSIGSELTENHADKRSVINSNPIFMINILRKMGLDVQDLGILGDNTDEISGFIKKHMNDYDMLITSGGSSVGEMDLVESALTSVGAEEVFHGLKLKPGRTGGLYSLNGKPVIVTSGNIQASIIETVLIAGNVAQDLGYSVFMNPFSANVDRDVYFNTPKDYYNVLWLKVYELKNEIIASPVFTYSTSRSIPMRANAFSVIKSDHVKKNTVIEAYMIGEL